MKGSGVVGHSGPSAADTKMAGDETKKRSNTESKGRSNSWEGKESGDNPLSNLESNQTYDSPAQVS
jgi:hypothetical protein